MMIMKLIALVLSWPDYVEEMGNFCDFFVSKKKEESCEFQ